MSPFGFTRRPASLAAGMALVLLVVLAGPPVVSRLQMSPAVRTIAVGRAPAAVVVDARTRRVFVANFGSNTVSMLDAASGAVLATVAVAPSPARWPLPRPLGGSSPSRTTSRWMVPAA